MKRRWLFLVALFASFLGRVASCDPPRDLGGAPPERELTAEEREHWAYAPLAGVAAPAVAAERWNRNPVDRFLKSALDANDLQPMPVVSKTTLLRRVYFDLTGLPPTPTEIEEFLEEKQEDAYSRLVDRLLASPRYGERWAQHWLDLSRFAETDGFEHDLVRPNAWRFRDWVIEALNDDMPFDEFVRQQISGDELYPGDSRAAIATGFLLCGPDMPDLNLQEERRHLVLNEITATVGSVFLGLQFGCAQCHDHKYDALTQYDFYRLRSFFESVEIFRDHPVPTAEDLAERKRAEASRPPEFTHDEKRRRELEELGKERFREKNPDIIPSFPRIIAELTDEERREHDALKAALEKVAPLPELPLGRVVRMGKSRPGHLYLRGDFRAEGPVLERGFPKCLCVEEGARPLNSPTPRAELARWLTSSEQPLVARVIVNRLWKWHFGNGLAAATSDFGVMGHEPTHPELLDWLVRYFLDQGWSIKEMHRLLVNSEFYKCASGPFDPEWDQATLSSAREIWSKGQAADPGNALLWRRERQRLEGEAIRDAMLYVAGLLSDRRGGPGVRPPLPPEVTRTLLKGQWPVTKDVEDHRRRSVYLFVRRNLRYPLFDVFDRPDTNASCPERHVSTTATQSLVLFNSRLSRDCAQSLAGALWSETPEATDSPGRIRAAYLRVFNRPSSLGEIREAEDFLSRHQQFDSSTVQAAWTQFCLALFNASEFVFVD